jgi:putative ABC transport system permease protein
MEAFLQDLRYGIRMLAKRPVITFVMLVTLALGIGANTAIFSVVNAVLLRPLPYKDPDRLVRVYGNKTLVGNDHTWISAPDFADYQSRNQVFEELAAHRLDFFNITGGSDPEQIIGAFVTTNFFSALGADPAIGRTFLLQEGQAGADRVIILGHGLWQRRYGGDSGILGKTVTINNAGFAVVGVMPADFRSVEAGVNFWIPISLDGSDVIRIPSSFTTDDMRSRKLHFLSAFARLKPGVTLEQAQSAMQIIASELEQQNPSTNTGWSANVVAMHEDVVGDIRTALLVLLGTVGFVLLIACANMINLLFALATTRRKEIAIRRAMGAGQARVIRQLLTENLLLAVTGGLLGFLLAYWGVGALVALSGDSVPRSQEIQVDGWVLGFTSLVSVLIGVILGLAPALQASRPDVNEALKEGARGSVGGVGRHRIRSILVISELALSLLLLIGSSLMIKSFLRLREINAGFRPERLLTMYVSPAETRYPEDHQKVAYFRQILQEVETLPGVQSAAVAFYVPLSGSSPFFPFTIDGRPPLNPGETLTASYNAISSDYFRAAGIPLLEGREFTEQDAEKSPPVVIINGRMARRFWPDENPLGKHITLSIREPESREIVGVVGDIKHTRLIDDPTPEIYVPYLQQPWASMGLLARTSGEPLSMTNGIRNRIRVVDENLPVSDVRSMDEIISSSVSQPRFNTVLLSVFAALALVLASVGIYGVMAYSVSQRTHEISVRMAMGAQQRQVLTMVLRQGIVLALSGVGIGLIAAYILTRVMSSLLYEVSATDTFVFLATSLTLVLITLVASYIPARKATRVDPVLALREE